MHQDDFKLNVTLQLFAVIAKQPAFHQLRSVEQLGYITVLMQRYERAPLFHVPFVFFVSKQLLIFLGELFCSRNDSGVRGVQFIIQSNVKGPGQIDLRVESFLKLFETKLYDMPSDEFKVLCGSFLEIALL